MEKAIALLDGLVSAVGWVVRFLVLVMMAVILFEATARYFFNAPTSWSYDTTGWILVTYVFLGGCYAMKNNHMVRVDILFQRFSVRQKAYLDLTVSTALMALFTGALFWLGGEQALRSLAMNETSSSGGWHGPVYPAKFMVPLGAALLALAWIAHMLRQIRLLMSGRSS